MARLCDAPHSLALAGRDHDPASLAVLELERIAEDVSEDDIPALLGELERVRARLWQRLLEPRVSTATSTRSTTPTSTPDRLLTAAEAASLLGVNRRWIYDHADQIPGTRRLSARCLRFSERKLRRWFEQRTP